MERRRHPRQSISGGSTLTAKVIMSGGSLLDSSSPRTIEIAARPVDISQGGICVALKLDVPWETLTPKKEVSLLLAQGEQAWLLPATVTRHERDHRTIGLQFADPLPSLAPLIAPVELY